MLLESSETLNLTLTNLSNALVSFSDATGLVTINDNDSAVATIAAVTSGSETGPVNGKFTVTLSHPADTPTTTATFVITESAEFGDGLLDGAIVMTTVIGDLTINGVTNSVEMPVEAQLVDGSVLVVGSIDVVFADYGVEVPLVADRRLRRGRGRPRGSDLAQPRLEPGDQLIQGGGSVTTLWRAMSVEDRVRLQRRQLAGRLVGGSHVA